MTGKPAHACVERISHSRITVSEKGKTVTFINDDRNTYERVRVDNCLVTSGPRADWIVTEVGVSSVIIELKGKDVDHAVDQLFSTISNTECKPWLEKSIKMLIVCAKYPSFDTKVARAQVKARKLGITLKVICRTFSCELSQL